jgi:hypothetical protein
MPQTPKKSKDIYPASGPPVKINQRTGDAAPGQTAKLTNAANRRAAAVVNKSVDAVKKATLEKQIPDIHKTEVMQKLRASEAHLDKVNPWRKANAGVTAETLQKNLVRNNQATDLLKPPPSEKGKYDQLFKEGNKLSKAGDVHLERSRQLMDPKYILDQQMKSTAESRKAVFDEANKLEQDLAKNQGRKPVTNRPSTPAQVQSKATPKPAPASPIETAAKTSVGSGLLASTGVKALGVAGVWAAAQKGAGLPPKTENSAVDEWNKRTNYGRIQGPTSKALGVKNVKPGQ